ncbi:Histidine kinase, PAS domain-containing [Desulfonema limicola]|uniref:Histidine kinase, PAS domain-containing n=1 Tax=Desulfonema limicola TaxID=45656 RepID=A0A975B6X2_9BACT|nr:PAS domain S-box protein [Desulfonema limicola]QTA79908.1 Histidine kinase, PAS domain-containing [Desulfonema limicola]
MFNAFTVIIIFCAYMGLLLSLAMWVEKKAAQNIYIADNPLVYSLSLGLYCTSWSFYGTIGMAATSGLSYISLYIGPALIFIFGCPVLKKIIRIKVKYRITSIADFISARYDKSQAVAASITFIALIGAAPYIALQLKAMISTFQILADTKSIISSWIEDNVGPVIVILMILFTSLFGVRRLDPTERHPGITAVIAIESLVKLTAFLAAGIFIVYFIFNGTGDIFTALSINKAVKVPLIPPDISGFTWIVNILLSCSAVLFLPRQFHIAIVENYHEKHLKTACWLFPLYLFIICFFVFPIAMSGLLMGFPRETADTFLIYLPFYYDKKLLSLLVFIGGSSAATSMIIISSMTLSTMTTNHLFLPFIENIKFLGFMRRHLLKCRWFAVGCIIYTGYMFEKYMGKSYMLGNMGELSFAAVLQFAPSVIGGIFWKKGNKTGTLAGLWAGFFIWFYTLLIPAFVKNGWFSDFLKPENLFGFTGHDPFSYLIFCSFFINILLYILCSLIFQQSEEEKKLAHSFINIDQEILKEKPYLKLEDQINLAEKIEIMGKILKYYFSDKESNAILKRAVQKSGIQGKTNISILELADLYGETELILAGAIGAASARYAMDKGNVFSAKEADDLSRVYGRILAKLKITPEELVQKIHYYQDRENLLSTHARELEEKIKEKEKEIAQRQKAEEKYRNLFEFAPDGILITNTYGDILSVNNACIKIFRYNEKNEMLQMHVKNLYNDPDKDRPDVLKKLYKHEKIDSLRINAKDRFGRIFPVSLALRLIRYDDKLCILALIRDITQIAAMEKELKQYTENLERMVDEKTLDLKTANEELYSAIQSLEETQFQLAQNAHQAGMAELAVSVLHNIGNAVNSINVRTCGLERSITTHEVQSLEKICTVLNDKDFIKSMDETSNNKRIQLCTFFAAIIDIIKEKNNLLKEDLDFIRKGLDHIIEIISVQQKYAGLRGFESRVNINDLIKDAEEMLSDSLINRKIKTEFKLGDIPQLYLDKNKMIQIFINIIKNAYESIDSAGSENEKKISFITSVEQQDNQEYVRIVISDTGTGVDKNIQNKVFRYNFSTKGRETGFGLHDSANYIRAQNGYIELTNRENEKGVRVIIKLPVSEGVSG